MNKKKKVVIVVAAVLLVVVIVIPALFLSSRSYPVPEGQGIDPAAASQIALQHTGIAAQDADFLRAQAEMDDGRWEYEVKFFFNFQEYSYQIDAATGTILDAETEPIFDFFD